MINGTEATLKKCVVHKINAKPENPEHEDMYGVIPSKQELSLDSESATILKDFFFSGFKAREYYNLSGDESPEQNPVYQCVANIFEMTDSLYGESLKIARHLYEQGDPARVKGGNLFVAYFENVTVDGKNTDAVGIFKVENTARFMKLSFDEEKFTVGYDEGINLEKLDKGCLVFNLEQDKGYLVAVNDGIGRSAGAHYWIDMFLQARQRKDEYYQTQNVISLCKDFVTKELPKEYEVTKADQAVLMNKSMNFFKENERFDFETFAEEILPDRQVAQDFKKFKEQRSIENDVEFDDGFAISENAVKKQSRMFKSVIKLDRNFHVYVHGDSKFIEKGFDDSTNMQYYRLFFREEE